MLTNEEKLEVLHPPDLDPVKEFVKEAFQTKEKVVSRYEIHIAINIH